MCNEIIKLPATSDNSLAQALSYFSNKARVTIYGNCLKQDKVTFTLRKIVKIYIVYEIDLWDRGYDDYPTIEKSLFGAVKLLKNADIDNCKYSGYGIEFDRQNFFSR